MTATDRAGPVESRRLWLRCALVGVTFLLVPTMVVLSLGEGQRNGARVFGVIAIVFATTLCTYQRSRPAEASL